MLGIDIADPDRVESEAGLIHGLGLLPVRTRFMGQKTTHQVSARGHPDAPTSVTALADREVLRGYEIHMGETTLEPGAQPFLQIVRRSGEPAQTTDGAASQDGRVWGTYLHGIFDNDGLRLRLINALREARGLEPVQHDAIRRAAGEKERNYEGLADLIEQSIDVPRVCEIAGLAPTV